MPLFVINGQPIPDPNVHYNGSVLPRDATKVVKQPVDFTNNPSLITIGNGNNTITLPADVLVYIDGEKLIAESQIIDGVSVFERVSRRPYEINFECVVRDVDSNGAQIFPQDKLDNIFTAIWLPDSVQTVKNTFLNKLGIQELIIKNISPATVRGSTNIPLRMKCYENVQGQSIIIS